MDVNEYIESGAIEACLLGLATPEELQEMDAMIRQYPAVREAVNDFESMLEREALANTVPPPPALKEAIWQQINSSLADEKDTAKIIPVSSTSGKQVPDGKAKVVALTAAPKGIKWLRGAVAACVILLLGSTLLNFYYYGQYKTQVRQYNELLTQNNSLLTKNNTYEASLKMFGDTSMQQILLKGVAGKPGMVASVIWDAGTKDVWVQVNNLPKAPEGMEYQLWALADGVPVDAGMLNTDFDMALHKMKNIPKAQAFAITLEKKDRSDKNKPDLTQLYVMGTV